MNSFFDGLLCRYTNYGSQKAHDLSENPNAALLFYWNEMNRQVVFH
jgi:pyridoxine/pyridoxamine 5'-phosphate oxidase